MSARSKKAAARELLARGDADGIAAWAGTTRGALRALFSLTYEPDEQLRERAIAACGPAAAVVAAIDPEKVRGFLRGLFWLMNDESGGLGWHAPEVIGEVLVAVPELAEEYARLLPHFLHEEPFEEGTRRALERLRAVRPDLV